jgi:hypothetical protein
VETAIGTVAQFPQIVSIDSLPARVSVQAPPAEAARIDGQRPCQAPHLRDRLRRRVVEAASRALGAELEVAMEARAKWLESQAEDGSVPPEAAA